jgi:hypothetical protein
MEKKTTILLRHLLILLSAFIALTFGTASGRADERPAGEKSGDHPGPSKRPDGLSELFQGTVAEVVEAGRHTFVRVDTGKQQVWVAVPDFDGQPGDMVLVPPGVPYSNFYSNKLHRRFETIILVGGIRRLKKSREK